MEWRLRNPSGSYELGTSTPPPTTRWRAKRAKTRWTRSCSGSERKKRPAVVDGRLVRSPLGAGRRDDRREAAHDDVAVLVGPGRVHVLPGEVVPRAGGQDLHLPAPPRQGVTDFAEHGLGSAHDIRTV